MYYTQALKYAETRVFLKMKNLGARVRAILKKEPERAPEKRISFAHALSFYLDSKKHRRARTLAELKSVMARMSRQIPTLSGQFLRDLDASYWEEVLGSIFISPRQKLKAQVVLHGFFTYAQRKRWCDCNPIDFLEKPVLQESEIIPLSWDELKSLLSTARQPAHRLCMPPLALMLWAGLRPSEVSRLLWQNIDWVESIVVVPAQHAKTGGCRHVSITPVLKAFLQESGVRRHGPICPPDWGRRWTRLRKAAGLTPWRQDVLRHTFASYHVKKWHDFSLLQAEMGHRSASLLRTRYLSMQGLSREQAKRFWAVAEL